MNRFGHRVRRLLFLVGASVAFVGATLPTPAARAAGSPSPTWQAWSLAVDFAGNQPAVTYTAYVGTNDPTPRVLSSIDKDISKDCDDGSLTYVDGYAIFDGSSYITCRVPSWSNAVGALAPNLPAASNKLVTCDAGKAPLFAAADVRLSSSSSTNPIFDGRDLGLTFNLPSDGIHAQANLTLSSGTYSTPVWAQDSGGNRALLGQNGPAIVAVDAEFKWLDFLADPSWQDFFANNVKGATMGYRVEAPSRSWTTPAGPYRLRTGSALVYIGHDSATGANLVGELGDLVIDPGCVAG